MSIKNSKYNKDVNYICKLKGIRKIEKVYGKLKNHDVVLTQERRSHIINRRGIDAEDVLSNMVKTINNYDFVIKANNGCIRYVKMLENNYSYVVKLSLRDAKEGNSVITGMKIKTRKINKFLMKDVIIDSKI